jgi:hypothetical protein
MKRFLTPPLVVLAATVMFLEEVLWEILKRLTARLGKLPLLRQLEAWIVTLPPYPMILVFLLPSLFLFPIKLTALWLMANGHVVLGVLAIIAAKVVGTAFVARFFVLCKPKMLTIGWFRAIHDWLVRTRDRLYAKVKSYPLYHRVRARLHVWRVWAKRAVADLFRSNGQRGAWTRRWQAIRRLRLRRKRHAGVS